MKNFLLLLSLFAISQTANAARTTCYGDICEGETIQARPSRALITRLYNEALSEIRHNADPNINDVRILTGSVHHKITIINRESSWFSSTTDIQYNTTFTIIPKNCYYELQRNNSYRQVCDSAPRSEWKTKTVTGSTHVGSGREELRVLIQRQ